MDKTHYSVSEACKSTGVESHVLRYWEEELHLDIPRNGKNHRYYTELHIRLFQKIKELKERGYQLKAIEQVLERMLAGGDDCDPDEVLEQEAENILKKGNVGETMASETKLRMVQKKEAGNHVVSINQDKMEQFQQLMNQIIRGAIGQAIQENNEELSREISRQVNDTMLQELEYIMRVNNEKEEERFKALDETLRNYQKESKSKAEAAATKLPFFKRKKFGRGAKKV